MLWLHFDNIAEPLSWDVSPVFSICQAIKGHLSAVHLVEEQGTCIHPSVILILVGNQIGFRKDIVTEDDTFKLRNEISNT
jgi:poly-beta-hydroxyalkanoate depolymerase